MCASGWPITLLLFHLFDSAIISSLQSPSLSITPSIPPFSSNSGETTAKDHCLTISPSTLVVRFGDPVTANCSVPSIRTLVWQVSLAAPEPKLGQFLTWSVDKMTEWNIKPMCCALSDIGPACHLNLSLIVYKLPDSVSISFANHTGPMLDGHQYTLHCMVQNVAPIGNVIVTFYRGQTELHRLQSNYTEKTPMTEIFTLDINPCKDDDGVQYWCEAKLDLGAEGPQPPPVVMSQKLTAEVHFGPQFLCSAKLQVREGESISCEVKGNPKPLVTWFKDGQVVSLPTHSSKKHAGKYTVLIGGPIGQKNLTAEVEVEVLTGSGTANCCNRHFLLAVLLIQILTCCKTS